MSYKVDLIKYTAECDGNYLHLLRLFPSMHNQSEREIELEGSQLCIKVLERMPYTTELEIKGSSVKAAAETWMGSIVMKVRMYHDLKTAEVYEFGELRSPAPKNDYPNKRMHHRDEKIQWNRFLREWLTHTLQHGYSTELTRFCNT